MIGLHPAWPCAARMVLAVGEPAERVELAAQADLGPGCKCLGRMVLDAGTRASKRLDRGIRTTAVSLLYGFPSKRSKPSR